MNLLQIAGWIGTVAVVLAYLALSLGHLKPGRLYTAINLVGSVLVGASAAASGLWSVVALQVAWVLISAFALLKKGKA